MLPENVTQPIATESAIVPAWNAVPAPSVAGRSSSAAATSADAPPPKPLNTATI